MVFGPDVDHSVHLTPVAGGTERGQYTSAASGHTSRGRTMDSDGLLTVRDGHLCFDGVDLAAAAGRLETPFYVYSERRLRANAAALLDGFGARHPGTEVFFASKACSNLWFLHVVRDAGLNVAPPPLGQLRRRAREGAARGLRAAADRVQRRRQDRGGDRGGGGRRRARDPRRLPVRAGSRRPRGRAAPEAGGRGPARRRARAHAHPPRPRDRPRRQGRHRPRRRGDRLQACGGRSLAHAGRPAPARRLPDHQRRALPAGCGDGARPRRRGRATRPACGSSSSTPAAGSRSRTASRSRRRAEPPGPTAPRDYFSSALVVDDYAAAICDVLEARRPDLTLFLEPGRSVATTCGVLVTRVENVKTKKVRGAGGEVTGAEDWLTIDAGFNTLLEHTNYAWYFRTRGREPGRGAGRHALPAGGAALRRRRRVRRRRRHAVPALPGRRPAWATSSSSSSAAATRSR